MIFMNVNIQKRGLAKAIWLQRIEIMYEQSFVCICIIGVFILEKKKQNHYIQFTIHVCNT